MALKIHVRFFFFWIFEDFILSCPRKSNNSSDSKPDSLEKIEIYCGMYHIGIYMILCIVKYIIELDKFYGHDLYFTFI